MIVLSLIYGIFTGNVKEITEGVINSSIQTVELCIGFIGMWALWLGLMEIVKKSKLIDLLCKGLYPLIHKLFPEIPKGHSSLGAIALNFTANLLGLGNAATPFGLQAMKEMQGLNTRHEIASDAMCMFLVINTSSIQIIPTTVIALRTSLGSSQPTSIILPTLLATCMSTLVGVVSVLFLQKRYRKKGIRKAYD